MTQYGFAATMSLNKCWFSLLCAAAILAAASPLVSGQQNDAQATPTPSKKVSQQSPAKTNPEKSRSAKRVQKNDNHRAYSFNGLDPESISRRIQYDDDLIAKGEIRAGVYANRASLKAFQGKLAEAVADYSRAIKLDENTASLWRDRGECKLRQGDLNGAMADCEHGIALLPEDVYAYPIRGLVKEKRGDYEGALIDMNRAVDMAPAMPEGYSARGRAFLLLGRWEDAQSDYRYYCQLAEAGQDYPRFFIWMTQMRLGKKDVADAELSDYLTKKSLLSTTPMWTDKVGEFLLKKISEAELFAAVSTKPDAEAGQRCEAWYYAGLKKLLSDDKAAATEDFRQCVATKQLNYTEYHLATAELKSLTP